MEAIIDTLYHTFRKYRGVTIDSRQVKKGDIFFGIKGENNDGNRFAAKALEKGASYAVIDNEAYNINKRCLPVNDSVKTLQALALKHRHHYNIPFIGITGSNGKTTTKELINAVLSKKFKTCATKGNLNNHLGVPLTILDIHDDAEMAIVEMGANHIGEIATLSEIARPTHGLITNIGKAHLEGFGSFEGVIKAKTELYQYIAQTNGTIFIDRNNKILEKHARGIEKIEYGINGLKTPDFSLLSVSPFVKINWHNIGKDYTVESRLIGKYNALNICAAIRIGEYFGVPVAAILKAIKNYTPHNNRSQLIDTPKNNRLIMDAYNANPSSMEVALDNLAAMEAAGRSKGVILGDMMELGQSSAEEHRKILYKLDKLAFNTVILAGEAFSGICSDKFTCFASTGELIEWLRQQAVNDHLLLIKASRGMQLERITEYL
ncbi:MAG: UDP-N-acetylmuramoyl-tripeptide--D-alanyl-D-alanine ligase [Bacteroidales bacterium]|nr:UDP-N-acetylmuramoyl-tripeptide--D-alanyl-D-alanine ligase [Bacteroidales bacterium]